jgi:hypothetical protein
MDDVEFGWATASASGIAEPNDDRDLGARVENHPSETEDEDKGIVEYSAPVHLMLGVALD